MLEMKNLLKHQKEQTVHIHAAYVNGTETFYKKPKEIVDIAIRGMLNVLKACEINKIKELILISSSEVYHHAKIIPTPENIP